MKMTPYRFENKLATTYFEKLEKERARLLWEKRPKTEVSRVVEFNSWNHQHDTDQEIDAHYRSIANHIRNGIAVPKSYDTEQFETDVDAQIRTLHEMISLYDEFNLWESENEANHTIIR